MSRRAILPAVVLVLAVCRPAGGRLGGARRSRSKPRPCRFPASAAPATSSARGRAAGPVHDQRHRIRRLSAAADRRQLLHAGRHQAAHARLCDVLAERAAEQRAERLPATSRVTIVRHGARRGQLRLRTRGGARLDPGLLRAGRRAAVLHAGQLAGVAGIPLARATSRRQRRPYAQKFVTSVPLIETVPGAPMRRRCRSA